MSTLKWVEKLRQKLGVSKYPKSRTGEELLTEKECLVEALKMYEARVAELEANAVDFCRTSLHLQAVQSLLAAEQKKSLDLRRALTAYQCGAGNIGGASGSGSADDEGVEDARKEKAADELHSILAQFNFETAAEQSMSASLVGHSMSTAHPRMSESTGSSGASPTSLPVDDAQQAIQQLKLTIQGMKAAITSIHNQKTELQSQCDRLQGDVSKLQMQFTSCRRQLDEERTKRAEERDQLKRELSEQKMRNQEMESHSQLQVLRLEEKYVKENAALNKQVETNGREVERLKVFEDRYSEMSKQCREAKEALKASERSCEEGLALTSLRYQSLVFHLRTKFFEWHELMQHVLPTSDSLNSVDGERAKLPKPDPVLADGRKVLPLKQLDEAILQQDTVLFSKVLSLLLGVVKPILTGKDFASFLQRRVVHKEHVSELTQKFNTILFSLKTSLKAIPVVPPEVAEQVDEMIAEDSELAGEESELVDQAEDLLAECEAHYSTVEHSAGDEEVETNNNAQMLSSPSGAPLLSPLSPPRSISTPKPNGGPPPTSPAAPAMGYKSPASPGSPAQKSSVPSKPLSTPNGADVGKSLGPITENPKATHTPIVGSQLESAFDGVPSDEQFQLQQNLPNYLPISPAVPGLASVGRKPNAPTLGHSEPPSHAERLLQQAVVFRQQTLPKLEEPVFGDRESNLQNAVDLMTTVHEFILAKAGKSAVHPAKVLAKNPIDPNSKLGHPTILKAPAAGAGKLAPIPARAGGTVPGKLAVGQPDRKPRNGPPKKPDTPDLTLGHGKPKEKLRL